MWGGASYEGVSRSFRTGPPPGARTANGTALCHRVQLYRYFVSQSSESCRHNTFVLLLSQCLLSFRYRLSTETFGYTLVNCTIHEVFGLLRSPSQGRLNECHM
jgi:hypothetical protein